MYICIRFRGNLEANGSVVQLVRMPPCHGGGRGFESRPDRIKPSRKRGLFHSRPTGREACPERSQRRRRGKSRPDRKKPSRKRGLFILRSKHTDKACANGFGLHCTRALADGPHTPIGALDIPSAWTAYPIQGGHQPCPRYSVQTPFLRQRSPSGSNASVWRKPVCPCCHCSCSACWPARSSGWARCSSRW